MIEPVTANDIRMAAMCIGNAAMRAFEPTSLKRIAGDVCHEYGISFLQMAGPCRKQKFAIPRQEFMRRARKEGYSYQKIGDFICRDHATVSWGVKRATARLEA